MGKSARFVGGTGGKMKLNVEKWSFSQDLGRDIFQVVPDTSEYSILHLSFPNSPPPPKSQKQKKLKNNLYFWTNFKQFPLLV